MRQVQGSKLLYSTGGDQAAYLPDGRELRVVVTTEDGREVFAAELEDAPVQFGQMVRVPLSAIGPGEFTATVSATAHDSVRRSVSRAVSFRVEP